MMMEFQVNPETNPFLVSSARSLMWVNAYNKKVRAAFRPLDPAKLFRDVVATVEEAGVNRQWGNVHPLTEDGLTAAIAHILSYDLPAPEIIAHPACTFTFPKELFRGCRIQRADWLAEDVAVVVPQDRDFVGFVLLTVENKGLAVIHNASRSIAVCLGPRE